MGVWVPRKEGSCSYGGALCTARRGLHRLLFHQTAENYREKNLWKFKWKKCHNVESVFDTTGEKLFWWIKWNLKRDPPFSQTAEMRKRPVSLIFFYLFSFLFLFKINLHFILDKFGLLRFCKVCKVSGNLHFPSCSRLAEAATPPFLKLNPHSHSPPPPIT